MFFKAGELLKICNTDLSVRISLTAAPNGEYDSNLTGTYTSENLNPVAVYIKSYTRIPGCCIILFDDTFCFIAERYLKRVTNA